MLLVKLNWNPLNKWITFKKYDDSANIMHRMSLSEIIFYVVGNQRSTSFDSTFMWSKYLSRYLHQICIKKKKNTMNKAK